jgi:hypothetical protein
MSRLERPLLIVVSKSGANVSTNSMLKFYEGKVACRFLPLRARAAL